MRAAVEDVHLRHGKQIRTYAAQVAIERRIFGLRLRASGRHGNGENGIRAQLALVRSAVELDHFAIDTALVFSVHPDDRGSNDIGDVFDGVECALAEIAGLVAVAKFNGFMFTRGGAGWDSSASFAAVGQINVGFDGRIATRVEDLSSEDFYDFHILQSY